MPSTKLSPEERDALPTLHGLDAITSYCWDIGVQVARYRVQQAIQKGELPTQRRLVSNYHSASPRDVRAWLSGGAA
jgi:hypothetical protein